jgi:hypothetical protein
MNSTKNDRLCELLKLEKYKTEHLACDCGRDVYSCVNCQSAQYNYTYDYPLLKYNDNFKFKRLVDFLITKFGCLKFYYSCGEYYVHMGNPMLQGHDEDKYEALYDFIANLITYNQFDIKELGR